MSDKPKKRSAAEKVRIEQSIQQMRWMLFSVEKALEKDAPIGSDTAGAVMSQSTSIALQIAKHDAYLLAEEDAEKKPPPDLTRIKEGLEKRPFRRG